MTRLRIVLAVCCAAVAFVTARAADPAAGRQIYVSGSGRAEHPITASVGGTGELPATMLPCANCHGADGRGVAEGGVVPSNVTWLELTKPYRAATPNGRRRPPYNEASLARAIREGVDPAGQPLHAAMPRYAISSGDLADLVSYLKILGRDAVPGVTETSVRAATIVPDSPAGAQMAAVLSAYFKDAGEIHGRRVTLERVSPEQLDATLAANPPFAFVGGTIAGTEERVEQAVERAAVPLVLPVSLRADASDANKQRFYLAPGLEDQLYALLRSKGPTISRVLVVSRHDESTAVPRRAIARLEQKPESAVVQSLNAAELNATTAVLLLDPASPLATVPAEGTSPLLFVASSLPQDFFASAPRFGGRIRVALTTTPADLTAGGLAEFKAFAARHDIPATHMASQLSAYAAAKVLVHALKQSGRELTREALRASIEGLYEFETGVTPALTFGRGRRIAAPRVHIAAVDPASGTLIPAGTFDIDD